MSNPTPNPSFQARLPPAGRLSQTFGGKIATIEVQEKP